MRNIHRARSRTTLTLFSVPRPWVGHIGDIQWNAMSSWKRLPLEVEIIIIGDDDGTAEACSELGLQHSPFVARTEAGTPMANSAFALAKERASHQLLCYANADIVLCDDFARAVRQNVGRDDGRPILLFGRRTDIEISGRLRFEPGWQERLRELGEKAGFLHGTGVDYLVFSNDLYPRIPAFALGRGCWDIWLINAAIAAGADVMDATPIVRAWHQNHDYDHLPADVRVNHPRGRRVWKSKGAENAHNRSLVEDPSWLTPYHHRVRVLVGNA